MSRIAGRFTGRPFLALVLIALPAVALGAPATASAAPAAAVATGSAAADHAGLPTASVSLGDSYISGEAGRWKGNSASSSPDHLGTDRGIQVYGDTVDNGCHRSDVAPIKSAWLITQKSINLACSGAKTVNVLRASAGGQGYQGEAPQDDQLATVAKSNDVKLIVLDIGGNDLGFGSIVSSCVVAYLSSSTPCSETLPPTIEAGLPKVAAAVGATVDDVRATMAAAGYGSGDYRLILESYPAPLPDPGNTRYSGTAPDQRASVGGCPFLDVDEAWAHSYLSPAMSQTLAGVAASHNVQFLDLLNAFRGHELCAASDQQSTGHPTSSTSEWIRFIDLAGQGDISESLHPNYFGQKALGQCLTLAVLTSQDVSCAGAAGLPSWAVHVTEAKQLR